jgi:putative transposase
MKLHRNSQKRIYIPHQDYFVTSVVYGRIPYFAEDIFTRLFFEEIMYCRKLKDFVIHGLVIMPEHFHLLFRVFEEYTISHVMHAIKINFSRDVNRIINGKMTLMSEGEKSVSRLRPYDLDKYRNMYIKKYGDIITFPKFQWQRSYYDHYIRNQNDFDNHLNYILNNPLKHKKRGHVYIPGYNGIDTELIKYLREFE